jgi:hypothetical protein
LRQSWLASASLINNAAKVRAVTRGLLQTNLDQPINTAVIFSILPKIDEDSLRVPKWENAIRFTICRDL